MTLHAGEVIGSYKIVAQIGSGGMATVYKAYQPKLDRYIAIKVLHESFSQEDTFMARFAREARIVARLDHPNIVPVYDYDDYNGQPYLVMKFVEGQTLKQLMRKTSLPYSEIVGIMEKVGSALHYAHQEGILHRDIKPSNILIDERGESYLTDFGLARITQQGESTLSADTVLGTPHYISPEQAKGETELDARTDVYSLGIVLYELVTGRVPFIADASYAIIHDQIHKPPPSPTAINPDISPEMEAAVLKALAKNPGSRYATPLELAATFRRAVAGKPKSETPVRPAAQSASPPPIARSAPRPPSSPLSPPIPGLAESLPRAGQKLRRPDRQLRRELRTARKEAGKELKKARKEVGESFKAMRWGTGGQYTWRPGTKWATDIYGNPGFYTQEELDAMEESLSEEERIRRRIKKRLDARKDYFIHLAMYVMVNLMLWMIWFLTMPGGFMWPLISMAGWGIGLVAHTMDYYMNYGGGANKFDEIVRREMEREMQRMYGDSEKAKHDDFFPDSGGEQGRVRLSEDGEFTESFVEERNRQNRRQNE